MASSAQTIMVEEWQTTPPNKLPYWMHPKFFTVEVFPLPRRWRYHLVYRPRRDFDFFQELSRDLWILVRSDWTYEEIRDYMAMLLGAHEMLEEDHGSEGWSCYWVRFIARNSYFNRNVNYWVLFEDLSTNNVLGQWGTWAIGIRAHTVWRKTER